MTEDPTAKAFAQIIATVSPGVLKDYPQPVVPETVSHTSVNSSPQETRMVAANTAMKAENVKQGSWTENLGPDEYVAVDDAGNVISRSDKATLERTYPNATLFGAKDFKGSGNKMQQTGVENPVLVNPPVGVATTPSGHPVSDALEKDGAFDHDGNGKPGSKKGADSTASKGKAKKTAAKK